MTQIETIKRELKAAKSIAKAVEGFDTATARKLLEAAIKDLEAPTTSGKVQITE